MNRYLKIASPVIFLISFLFIVSIKSIPTGKLWNNYIVIYTPVNADDIQVLEAIHASGIKDEVSLSGQFLPVSLSANSVEIAMFKINRDSKDFSYYKDRNAYFFDKSQNYRLYYIPSEYKNKIKDCLSILSTKNIQAQSDAASSYPWIIPLLALVLTVILSLFSKKKVMFLLGGGVTVVYLLSNPFYPAALANILILLCLFFISNIWKRKGSFLYLLNNYAFSSMIVIALVSAFSISIKSGSLFIAELVCIASLLMSYSLAEELLNGRKSFNPVYIKSAKMVSIFARKANIVMVSVICSAVLFIAVFLLTSSQSVTAKFSKMLLPSASSTQAPELPQLENYYQWIWNIKTYPYKSLNAKENMDYLTEYPRFKDEGGFVKESKDMLAFNQNFKENTFNEIDDLQFNSIEKVLKSEGEGVKTDYKSTNTYQTNLFGKIMMLFCLFVLLFVYFSTIIRKEIRK